MAQHRFNRQWWWMTLIVITALGIMTRLGIWQLERLSQRRAFNTRVTAQIEQPPLLLNPETLSAPLTDMEYRAVVVTGTYDFTQEVAIRNQAWNNQYGFHLLTPLVIAGSRQAVLIDRGWIPAEDRAPEHWLKYQESGKVIVKGVIRSSRSRPDFGGVPDPISTSGERLIFWNNVNIPRIDEQVSYTLISIYVQQAPESGRAELPYRDQPTLNLSEGSHLGYAIQWFIFATILGIGYPLYIRNYIRQQTRTQLVEGASL